MGDDRRTSLGAALEWLQGRLRARRWSRVVAALGVIAAAAFAALVAIRYVAAERIVYWWDFAGYHDLARRTAEAFAHSDGLHFVYQTLGKSYNAVFALPLVPFLTALDDSRFAYVVGLTLVFHVPFAIVLGDVASRAISAPGRRTAWFATAFVLLSPGVWLPVLRGYPDSAAGLLLALAMRAYLMDTRLGRLFQPALIGSLLAAAVLLRRHFLVAVPAFLLAMAVVAFLERRRAGSEGTGRSAWLVGRGVASTALAGAVFTALVAPPFLRLLVMRDYYDLYRSYLLPLGEVVSSEIEPFGGLVAAAALVGLALGMRSGVLHRGAGAFVALEGGLDALLWLVFVRQGGLHYCLHGAPLVVTGMVALAWTLARRLPVVRAWALASMAAFVVGTFHLSLWVPPRGLPRLLDYALPADAAPLVRRDLDSLRALVAVLRADCAEVPVFVAASSDRLNSNLLAHADRQFRPPGGQRLEVLPTPEVDSRDRYPLPRLLNAGCVVVAHPLQLHLDRAEQDLVAVARAMFQQRQALAPDFVRVPASFALAGGVEVEVFRRVRPSSLAAGLDALGRFEAAIPERAETQPDWAVVSRQFAAWVDRLEGGATSVVLHPSAPGTDPPAVAVYLPPVDGPVRVSGELEFVDPRCAGVEVQLGPLGSRPRPLARVVRRPSSSPRFETSLRVPRGRRLGLLLTIPEGQSSIDCCLVRIDELQVAPDRAPASS